MVLAFSIHGALIVALMLTCSPHAAGTGTSLRGSEAGTMPPVRVSSITCSPPGSVAWATSDNVTGGYARQVARRPQAARLLPVSSRSK